MAEFTLPEFTIDKNEPELDIRKLVKIIKPKWNHETVQIQPISGGFSCKIYKCTNNENKDNDAITIRIRNLVDQKSGKDSVNQTELDAIQHVSVKGHFPTVRAIFANGYVYDFIEGNPIYNMRAKTGYINEEILALVAKELVFIHNVHLEQQESNTGAFFFKMVKADLKGPVKHNYKDAPTYETILEEIDFLENYLKQDKPDVVLCHGDAHFGNCLWNDDQKKVTFIDWEGAYLGSPYLEIGHFTANLECYGKIPNLNNLKLPNNAIEKFLKTYYEENCCLQQIRFEERRFEEFQERVQKCKMAAWLFYLAVTLLYPSFMIEFAGCDDINEFYAKEYFKLKKVFIGRDSFEPNAKN